MKKRVKYIEQNEHSECGLSCATMILHSMNISISLFDLREKFGVPKGGNNLLHIRDIFAEYNIKTKAIRINDLGYLQNIKYPVICYWENNHFIVLEKITTKYAYIVDPAVGKSKLLIDGEFKDKFSNVILQISNESLVNKKNSGIKSKVYSIYYNLLKSKSKYLVSLLIISLLLQIISLGIPLFIQYIVDNNSELFTNNFSSLIVIVLACLLLYFVLQLLRGLTISYLQLSFTKNLLNTYVLKLTNVALSFFVNRTTGDIIFRSNLINYIQQVISQQFIKTIIDTIFIFVYIVIMFNYSLLLTIITLVMTTILILISILNTRKYIKINDRTIILQSRSSSKLLELVDGIETIKSLGFENEFYSRWNSSFDEQQVMEKKKNIVNAWLGGLNQSIQFFIPFIVIITSLYLVKNEYVTLGLVVSFPTIVNGFLTPITGLLNSVSEIVIVRSYFNKINEVLLQKDFVIGLDNGKYMEDFEQIKLKNICFKYSYFENYVLNNINFTIKKGDKVAIVGASGSGKSTLLKILSGLYKATDGLIFINDEKFENINSNSFHKLISYVNQQPTMFNASIFENITMNCENYNLKDIEQIIYDTTIDRLLENLPKGLQTQISESGMNLSGGQIQKLSIARALIRKPKILLLDEPTSSLDNISESHIVNALKKYEMSMIVVSHRLSTIRHFDKIVVMEQGKIVETGTHEELMKKGSVYFNMYSSEC